MKSVQIVNRTQNTVLADNAMWAQSFWSRLRGFLARPEPQPGQGLILDPCQSVHMWGMRYSLDILFSDHENRVVHIQPSLKPWKLSKRVPSAQRVIELPVGTLQASGTCIGDELDFRVLEKA